MSNDGTYIIRPIRRDETGLLKAFLYEAIFVPDGVEPPPRSVVDLPELALYVAGFGERRDDRCLVADCDGNVAGAVWVRVMNDYGHIDDETPSLAIALYKPYRNRGIGTRLMTEMLALLSREGYRRVSLSVQKANYAAGMYLKLGFRIVKETEEEFVMVKDMEKEMSNSDTGYRTRPLTADDIPAMQRLVKETILGVNARDYTREEVADWASCLDNEARQRELLAAHGFIAALDETGLMVGIASMNAEGYLHSLFVHKDWQGRGVASFLLDEVERKAREYGGKEIYCEVSLTARPFFEKRGYVVEKTQKQRANRLLLTNFAMRKRL